MYYTNEELERVLDLIEDKGSEVRVFDVRKALGWSKWSFEETRKFIEAAGFTVVVCGSPALARVIY